MRRIISLIVIVLSATATLALMAPAAHAMCNTPLGRYAFINC